MVCTNSILDRRLILNDHELGSYECKDPLGNVHLVLSDRKPFQDYDNTLAAYDYNPGFRINDEVDENEVSLDLIGQ